MSNMLKIAKLRFRWVQCQLDYIKGLKCDAERREALVSLPPGLPDTYQRILNPIPKSDLGVALKALRWLVCCQRPLTLSELAVAIAIEPGSDRFNDEKKLDDDELILGILGSLVRQNAETSTVHAAHFSVTEYLTSRTLPDRSTNCYYIDEDEGHEELLNCCLTYLSFHPSNIVGEGETLFRSYAIFHWPLHAKRAEGDLGSFERITSFLSDTERPTFRRWQDEWEARFDPNLRVNLPNTHSGLYYAALFSLPRVVEELLKAPEAMARAGGQALLAAARDGDDGVVDLLLQAKGEDTLTARTALGWTVLHRAVYNRHIGFVRKLLTLGVDVDAQDQEGWSALSIAISEGYGEIVKILLSNGANPSQQVKESLWAPLHLAAQRGKVHIVQSLLDAGADLTQLTASGSTALQISVLYCQREVFRLLVNQRKPKMQAGSSLLQNQPLDEEMENEFHRHVEEINGAKIQEQRIPRLSATAFATVSGTGKA